MSSDHPTTKPPVIPKPPAHKDSNAAAQPPLKPPPKALVIPNSSRYPTKKKRQSRRRRSCCRTSCCCTVIVILIVAVSLVLAGGFLYLWYEPKAPVFHLQSFRFTQFNVSAGKGDDGGGTYLSVSTESRVELKNPNRKLGLYYGSTQVDIRLPNGGDDIPLGSKKLPGFTQAKRNVTSIKVVTPLTRVELVGGNSEGKKLVSDFNRKLVRVTVEVRTTTGIEVDGKLKIGSVVVNVKCKNVQLKSIEVEGFMPKCSIDLWDTISNNRAGFTCADVISLLGDGLGKVARMERA